MTMTDPSPARSAGPPLSGEGEEALSGRSLSIARTRNRPLAQAAAGRKAGQAMEDLVPGAQREAERARHAVAADRELAHRLGDLPDAVTTGREKGHVAGAEAMDFAILV